MPHPKRKRVSEEVLQRISDAMTQLATDDKAPRTKRQIEAISGLGHDAVARAFRQDADEPGNPHQLTAQFNALRGPVAGSGRSPQAHARRQNQASVDDLRHRIKDLQTQLDRYAMSLFAHHVAATAITEDDGDIIPIRRPRTSS